MFATSIKQQNSNCSKSARFYVHDYPINGLFYWPANIYHHKYLLIYTTTHRNIFLSVFDLQKIDNKLLNVEHSTC